MSTLETNSIGKYSGNNVSVDDSLNLKSYTTAQRDALTSVAGDMIYNSDDNKPQFYDGTEWKNFSSGVEMSYLVIAGGGGGGRLTAGGGAGGYRNSYASETSGGGGSTEDLALIQADNSSSYQITVGAGGTGASFTGGVTATNGADSVFNVITSTGGGAGPDTHNGAGNGGSGSGSSHSGGTGTTNQGFAGGTGGNANYTPSGGGGAGAVGGDWSAPNAGAGGNGLASSITGSSVTRGGGGGSGGSSYWSPDRNPSSGGTGGGGDGADDGGAGTAGTVNTGGGGGGGALTTNGASIGNSGAGASGIVILRWATADATISVGAGLTSSSATVGSDTVVTFTAGTGTVSFS